ncbi:hypothetical protein MU0083_003831 [[Mycobacterium] kokjensenii]|uniref:Uncharacterized protein n=1 Tax=[Mycobacterium] kokjensenii TaxID=3064287 RepID=A0ABM9LWL8_9MYCO|nr:hypothetical protein [Mycolicibacter sp. MU0083]CAJ1505981.1 hypothetical protein MU0083_003831 [Mycolicibacter sp. MU0083]
MAFVPTSVLTVNGTAEDRETTVLATRLRRYLATRREVRGAKRATRYVQNLPIAVLGDR